MYLPHNLSKKTISLLRINLRTVEYIFVVVEIAVAGCGKNISHFPTCIPCSLLLR